MIKYEVINFYYGVWGSSCGEFDHLLDATKEDMHEYFHIIVRLPKGEIQ